MKVLHINATSHTGGAARAMQRLHNALIEKGHQSRFLVGRSKYPNDENIKLIWDQIDDFKSPIRSLQSRVGNQIERYLGIHPWANKPLQFLAKNRYVDWADVIDLRNLFGGYFNIWSLPELTKKAAVVWRLPDLWALTGHCAYPYDCQRWITGCFDCPLLKEEGQDIVEPSPTIWDGTKRVWQVKSEIYQKSELHVIVTTNWMKENVERSILNGAKSINIISNGVELNIYKPISKLKARHELGLPDKKKILLWSAGSKGNFRKGYHLVVEAMELYYSNNEDPPLLLTMAGDSGWKGEDKLPNEFQYGFVSDPKRQALIYSAADVFLCTTLADAQPQTALESLACGTPVISFDIGPMSEIVKNRITGILVNEVSAISLKNSIDDFFEGKKPNGYQFSCRDQAVKNFDLKKQTLEYIDLYANILDSF